MNLETAILTILGFLGFLAWQIKKIMSSGKMKREYEIASLDKAAKILKESHDAVKERTTSDIVDMSNKRYGKSRPTDDSSEK